MGEKMVLGVCSTCLSHRRLTSLGNLLGICRKLLDTVMLTPNMAICWECTALLKKCLLFKRKAETAKETLTNLFTARYDVQSLSTLKCKNEIKNIAIVSKQTSPAFNASDVDMHIKSEPVDSIAEVPIEEVMIKTEPEDVSEKQARPVKNIKIHPINTIKMRSRLEKLIPVKLPKNHPVKISTKNATIRKMNGEVITIYRSNGEKISIQKVEPITMAFTRDPQSRPACNTENVATSNVDDKIGISTESINTDVEPADSNVKEKDCEIWCKPTLITESELQTQRRVEMYSGRFLKAEFKCPTCIIMFENKEEMDSHNSEFHIQRSEHEQCDICQSWVSKSELKRHRVSHLSTYQCVHCDRRDPDTNRLWRHYSADHKPVNRWLHVNDRPEHYPCPDCELVFPTVGKRKYHRLKVHRNDKRYACDLCAKSYVDSYGLNLHIKSAHREDTRERLPCPECNSTYLGQNNLFKHIRDVHGSDPKEVHHCSQCNIVFKTRTILLSHLEKSKIHSTHVVRKYICDYCDKRFQTKREIHDHIARHINYKVPCNICGKEFVSEQRVKRHVKLRHLSQPPRVRDKMCEICGKAFYCEKILLHHKAVHSDERPFACDCGATFKFSAALYTHRKLKKH